MTIPTPPSLTTPAIDCHAHAQANPAPPNPNKKKIFVFCDGTGNEFVTERYNEKGKLNDGNSNVVKLYTALRVADNQVAYYHPGVGTMGDPTIRWAIPRFWSKVKGLAFGAGFRTNVLDAYRYLMDVYNDGDEIYIFGFSRGAYTARTLAGILHICGLLCQGNEGHILYAWNIFHAKAKSARKLLKNGDKAGHRIVPSYAFAETYSRKVTIRFMGIWDTVSSIGWIYEPLRLLNMAQNPIIQVGRHAVSIDERRAFYRDNLWGDPVPITDPEWPEELRARNIQQDIAQVWFPGAHSDVGGSYPQAEAAPANQALRWMIGELQNNGAELCQERIDMVLGVPTGFLTADRVYTPPPKPDHRIHHSLKGFGWWLLQTFPQQYYDKDDAIIQWRVPYGTPRHIPARSLIHPSAVQRLRGTVAGEEPYCPPNLKLANLQPLHQPMPGTTANLDGCYVSTAPPARTDNKIWRCTKVLVGWLTFVIIFGAAFLLILILALCVLSIARYVLNLAPVLVLRGRRILAHGLTHLFRWVRLKW